MTCYRSGVLSEVVLVDWFVQSEYPDGDELLVHIDTCVPPVRVSNILYLSEIDPSHILYEIDPPFMFMMRVEGLDVGL